MRICYLTYSLDRNSGWGRYAFDLVNGVRANGHEAAVILVKGGVSSLLKTVLTSYMYEKDCDVVHAMDVYPYGVIAYFIKMFFGKKFVLTAQGTYAIEPLYKAKTSFLCRRACKSGDALIAISGFTKNELLKKIKPRKVEVIHHGVNLELFYKEHLPAGEDFVLSVGALKYRKGYHISIQAFALAKKKFPGLKYKIVGDQGDVSYLNHIKNLAEKYDVSQSIEFLGEVSESDLQFFYQTAKLFVLTSINANHSFEGFGLVFLEAAAAGLPVIGTIGNGIEDAVRNGYNGILVEQNSIKGAAEAMITILSDSVKWQKMSEYSRKWAKEHSLDKMVAQYIAVYKSLL